MSQARNMNDETTWSVITSSRGIIYIANILRLVTDYWVQQTRSLIWPETCESGYILCLGMLHYSHQESIIQIVPRSLGGHLCLTNIRCIQIPQYPAFVIFTP